MYIFVIRVDESRRGLINFNIRVDKVHNTHLLLNIVEVEQICAQQNRNLRSRITIYEARSQSTKQDRNLRCGVILLFLEPNFNK